jgi:uncharacterized protein involved in response to NO
MPGTGSQDSIAFLQAPAMKPITVRPLPADAQRAASAASPAWRFAWLLASPHRLGFFAAALMLAASASWWTAALVARAAGLALPWALSPSSAHGLLMTLGFTPLFIAGFLFTAGPKWLGLGPVAARVLVRPVLAIVGGWCLAIAGFHLAGALAAAGVALVALGWGEVVLRFAALVRASRVDDRVHSQVVAVACGVGVVALALAALALALGLDPLLRSATQAALWGFVAVVFAAVSHRMIPFFTASALPMLDAWRPMWLLAVFVGVLAAEGLVALVEPWWWPPPVWRWAQVVFEAPAAALLLWLAWRWGVVQSLRIRLLAMLHGGFVWFGLALALAALSHALMAATDGTLSLGLAPLHALTMGYLGATLVAMTTRVSAGHGGRPLAADDIAWWLYWLLQAAVLLRVAAALWPDAGNRLLLAAVFAWAGATVAWALRYGGWFGRPRVDGRPG